MSKRMVRGFSPWMLIRPRLARATQSRVALAWAGREAGGSWGGRIDSGGSFGVVFNASNRFGAPLAGARFFFGFRPRLLGIGLNRCNFSAGQEPELGPGQERRGRRHR